MTSQYKIAIRGAGVAGLWQALTLARRGHRVILAERSEDPFADACSPYAGAMLAPRCEEESAEPIIRELGLRGIEIWKAVYPDLSAAGSLVVAPARDRKLLDRFERMTQGGARLGADQLEELEPSLVPRFGTALFYADEAHLNPGAALSFLLNEVRNAGVVVQLGVGDIPAGADFVIDCRGLAAQDMLPTLRGVRGERIVVRAPEIAIERPVRLLHPRFPLYLVPWGEDDTGANQFMIGATSIEREDDGPVTLRSALELLSAAYVLDPAFGEAEILSLGASVRPAFPDNRPRIIESSGYIYVNGLYRHGFLLAPVMAEQVAHYLETGVTHPEVFVADFGQR
ncbi:MAG: FAD-dependent oxidoreductase [Methyloceanibacter sp.]|uniref:FAD-dependent oxidoreductase n=1 Tax=Methyloceanibacter sp. TaxID=1965321 RepID=UPI001D72652E|nr:FAD-dependent oxidoreductase [Methyloceanibacter sp.]MCB1442213.1 FAD-dependent oxidoreductase [Methyloceanibacter sp.]